MEKEHNKTGWAIVVVVLISMAVVAAVISIKMLDTTGKKGSGLGPDFAYNVAELSKVDPDLILYEQAGSFETGFSVTSGIAVGGEDKIHVIGDKAMKVFDFSGKVLEELALDSEPSAIAVASGGRIFIGVKDHIHIFDGTGLDAGQWESLGERAIISSIAVGPEDIYVADAGNRQVVRYDSLGKIKGRVGEKDEAQDIPGFIVPSPYFDLAIGNDNMLRVVNPGRHLIETYTSDGERMAWWGEASNDIEGFCGCCNPSNFAILPDGGYVTVEKGLVRAKTFDAHGNFIGVVASPAQLLSEEHLKEGTSIGFDIAADNTGKIYVLDRIENQVKIFTLKEKEDEKENQ